MRKFFVVLFLLIILAGTGFFFGWAQAGVPPGSYGVLRSKTHGTDPLVIRDGDFRWIWYKLIPTNANVAVFNPKRIVRNFNSSGFLPSGRYFAALAGLNTDFPWSFTGDFSFTIKPESLPSLVEKENLNGDESFRAFETSCAGRIEDYLNRFFKNTSGNIDEMEEIMTSNSLTSLISNVERNFPYISGFTCIIRTANGPDFDLYRAVKLLNEEYLNKMQLVLSDDVLKEAEARIKHRIRMDELSQYGDILTKFPVLLEYMALEKGFILNRLEKP